MIVDRISSSSINCFDICEFSFFLEYCLFYRQPEKIKTLLGTVFHSIMESLATMKLAHQKQENMFKNNIVGEMKVDLENNILLDRIIEMAFDYHEKYNEQGFIFGPTDRRKTRESVYTTISLQNGLFDPRKRDVIGAEIRFNIPIEEDWAKLPIKNEDGTDKYLNIKGFIDLVLKIDDKTYDLVDYKTGVRKDWTTNKEKDYNYFCQDFQLQLYFYALSKLYPDLENILVTIHYVNDGGPFTIPFSIKDNNKILQKIKYKYEKICNCTRPKLKSPNRTHFWCGKVCWANRQPHKSNPLQTICEYTYECLIKNGMEYTINNEKQEKRERY